MAEPENAEEMHIALKKHFGEEKFLGILTLSFLDAFLGAASAKILPIPLFSFFPKESGQCQFHVHDCEGKGTIAGKEVLCVGVVDLLLGAAVAGIPVFLQSASGTGHADLAEDFLKLLHGVPPAPYFPEVENGTLPPIIMNIENLGETELRALKKIEKGETPGGERFPAIFIVDLNQKAKKDIDVPSTVSGNFLCLTVPSPPAGDSLAFLDSKRGQSGFDGFFEGFVERASRYLETDKKDLLELKGKWPALYYELAGHIQNNPLFLDSAREWFHMAAALFTIDHGRAFHQEIRALIQWTERFEMAGLISYPELERNMHVPRLEELFQNFESFMSIDDAAMVYKLAPFFSLMGRARQSLSVPNPVESYFEAPGAVTIRDIFIPFFIFLSKRTKAASIDLSAALNMSVENYGEIISILAAPLGLSGTMSLEDPETSAMPRAFKSAMAEGMEKGGGIDLMMNFLLRAARELINNFRQEPCLLNRQIVFIANDIFTLAGFLCYYKKELSIIVNCFGKESQVDGARDAIRRFYNEKREREALLMPSVFLQSIPRILG